VQLRAAIEKMQSSASTRSVGKHDFAGRRVAKKKQAGPPSRREMYHSRSAYLFSTKSKNGLIMFKNMDCTYAGLSSMYASSMNERSLTKKVSAVGTFPMTQRFPKSHDDNSPGPIYNIREDKQMEGNAWSFAGGDGQRSSFMNQNSTNANVGPTSYSAGPSKDKMTQKTVPAVSWSSSRSKRWKKEINSTPGPKYSPKVKNPGYSAAVNFGPRTTLRAQIKERLRKASLASNALLMNPNDPNADAPAKNTRIPRNANASAQEVEEAIKKVQKRLAKEKRNLHSIKPPTTFGSRLPPTANLDARMAKRNVNSYDSPGPRYNISHKGWVDPYPRAKVFANTSWRG
jgi:hypothetical protein